MALGFGKRGSEMKIRTVARFCVYHYQERLCKYVLGVVRKMRKRGLK